MDGSVTQIKFDEINHIQAPIVDFAQVCVCVRARAFFFLHFAINYVQRSFLITLFCYRMIVSSAMLRKKCTTFPKYAFVIDIESIASAHF